MPELPEVETIRKGLEKYMVGHSIESVDILHPGIIQGDTANVLGSTVTGIRRIGKGLIIDLSNDYSLAIHIKLTGQLIYRDKETEKQPVSKDKVGSVPNKFTHVLFHLGKPEALLYYNDQRRFGWIKILPTKKVMELPFFKDMGPEPFKDLTLEKFKEIVGKKPTKIKPLIMDQTRIGGIGNIYANDALFRARIDPRRPAKTLTEKEITELFDSIIAVMEKSFKEGGASELSFVNVLGQEGNYQSYTLVYAKTGKDCPRGNGVIERITLAGRGTFFCKACQV